MGGSSSKQQIPKISNTEWVDIGTEKGVQIVSSKMGKGEGEIRVIPVDPKHFIDKQNQIYSYRANTDTPLVKCFAAEFNQSQNRTMCGNEKKARVLTERIPLRLSDIKNLTFPQSLYVLSQSFRGFQDLLSKAGIFQITDKLIGFNKNNQVKVWLNQNFAFNHPDNQRPILQTTTTSNQEIFRRVLSQSKMIQKIVQLVENKTQKNKFSAQLKQKLLKPNLTMEEAWNITQSYIKGGSIFVPNRISNCQNNQIFQPSSSRSQTYRNQQNKQNFVNRNIQYDRPEFQKSYKQNNQKIIQNRFTYQASSITQTNRSNVLAYQVNASNQNNMSVPSIQSRPTAYTFSQNYQNHTNQYHPQTVNISNGNTYGVTQTQAIYQYGAVCRPISRAGLDSSSPSIVPPKYQYTSNGYQNIHQ